MLLPDPSSYTWCVCKLSGQLGRLTSCRMERNRVRTLQLSRVDQHAQGPVQERQAVPARRLSQENIGGLLRRHKAGPSPLQNQQRVCQ